MPSKKCRELPFCDGTGAKIPKPLVYLVKYYNNYAEQHQWGFKI
jgi:hypothetical protein